MAAFGVGLVPPVDAQRAFAQRKLLLPSFNWDNVYGAEHAAGVAVAGITKQQALQDVATVLKDMIDSGNDVATAKKALREVLKKNGYWGDVEVTNQATGEQRISKFNESRLSLILDTNARSALSTGRWQRGLDGGLPLVGYFSKGDSLVRPLHQLWDGTVLPKDHPFWDGHTPPCGYRCRCHFRFLSERDVADLARLRGPSKPIQRTPPANAGQLVPFDRRLPGGQTEQVLVPVGVDPGFGHSRAASRLAGIVPRPLDDIMRLVTPADHLPDPVTKAGQLLWS
ncbi:MAG: phage minor head protein, partial [Rhodoferax sp.]|nr:phage minor head protein [Rhodoferax sp.]